MRKCLMSCIPLYTYKNLLEVIRVIRSSKLLVLSYSKLLEVSDY